MTSVQSDVSDLLQDVPFAVGMAADLLVEAHTQFASCGRRLLTDVNGRDANHALRTRRQLWGASAGELLLGLHSRSCRDLVAHATGTSVFPTRCSYVRYDAADFLGPHHDTYSCNVTLLIPLTHAGELEIYPQALEGAPDDLFDTFVRGDLAGSQRIQYQPQRAYVLRGRQLAHARKPKMAGETTAVLCYGELCARPIGVTETSSLAEPLRRKP